MREWNISVPILNDSLKVFTPWGTSINSWQSRPLGAWAPPLITFISGTGRRLDNGSPRYLYNGISKAFDAALALARLTARIELAPKLDLLGVPSISIIKLSILVWSKADNPHKAGEIVSWILLTAVKTPFPIYFVPPSLNSCASWAPVLAPLGTIALPIAPHSKNTSASTVGFPLESSTCLASIVSIRKSIVSFTI